jgi:hypothetical protein
LYLKTFLSFLVGHRGRNIVWNQRLSPLKLWVWFPSKTKCTWLPSCDKICQFRTIFFKWKYSSFNNISVISWNIVESGVRHHQTNKHTNKPFSTIFQLEFGTVVYLLYFILLLHYDGGGQRIIQKFTLDGGGQCIIQKCTLDGGGQSIIQKALQWT